MRNRTTVTALFLANNFIKRALEEGKSLSLMKLQRLIYLAYREHLNKTNVRLFSERFSIWKYGPVVESVYSHFASYEACSIDKFYRCADGTVPVIKEVEEFSVTINDVWSKYKNFNGIELSAITNQKGTAWYKAWQDGTPYLSDKDISEDVKA